MARAGLLDALEALESHLGALVVVGAQAIYLHTGAIEVALAEYTTDGDVAVDPDLLSSDPLVEDAMRAAGFTPDPRISAIGSWISPAWRASRLDGASSRRRARAPRGACAAPRFQGDAPLTRHRGDVGGQVEDGHPGA